jgi:hypothetical protein
VYSVIWEVVEMVYAEGKRSVYSNVVCCMEGVYNYSTQFLQDEGLISAGNVEILSVITLHFNRYVE